jgi:hypothetical protein
MWRAQTVLRITYNASSAPVAAERKSGATGARDLLVLFVDSPLARKRSPIMRGIRGDHQLVIADDQRIDLAGLVRRQPSKNEQLRRRLARFPKGFSKNPLGPLFARRRSTEEARVFQKPIYARQTSNKHRDADQTNMPSETIVPAGFLHVAQMGLLSRRVFGKPTDGDQTKRGADREMLRQRSICSHAVERQRSARADRENAAPGAIKQTPHDRTNTRCRSRPLSTACVRAHATCEC